MKERELAKHTTCKLCNRLITAGGLPLFWCVTVERHGLDARAMRRQAGLGMVLGNAALASIMGPDEDLTQTLLEPVKLIVCESCMVGDSALFGPRLAQAAFDADKEREAHDA